MLALVKSDAPDPSGWKVQSDRICGHRVLCTSVPLRITAAHATDLLKEYIPAFAAAVSGSGGSSKKRNPSFSDVFEERSKDKSVGGGTCMKLRHDVAAYVSEDQYLATFGVAELGLLSGGTLQVVERLRGEWFLVWQRRFWSTNAGGVCAYSR